jgi:myo-inositol-1(or 4)-monophosphatase
MNDSVPVVEEVAQQPSRNPGATLASDVEVATRAASAGADVLRRRYGGELTHFAKSARDFATEADLESEQAVREVVAAAFPDDAFLGEEGGLTGASDARRTWLVDPLCGTLNFAARTPLACVNVALREGGVVTAAAVADPFADEIYWTDGRAAFVRASDRDVELRATPLTGLVDIDFDGEVDWPIALVSSPEFVGRFGPRVSSTSLALAWVATGQRAAYVHAGDVRDSVHFAAGLAVCAAAGCVVTDLAGAELSSSGNGLVAAADAHTHAAVVAAIRPLLG